MSSAPPYDVVLRQVGGEPAAETTTPFRTASGSDAAAGEDGRGRRAGTRLPALVRRPLRRVWHGVRPWLRKVRTAVSMARETETRTLYPEAERKGRLRVLAEQLYFLVRDGAIESYYFGYGRDRKDVSPNAFLTQAQFRAERDRLNLEPMPGGYTYACLARDKDVFSQIARALGHPVPNTLATLSRDGITWAESGQTEPFERLLDTDVDGFCKPSTGIFGQGAMAVRVASGALFIDGVASTIDAFRAQLQGRSLLQERVEQHAAYARLNPDSLNTLRIVTVLQGGTARALHTHVRIGRAGSTTDNVSAGGVVVDVDPETGHAWGPGIVWSGDDRWVESHPDTDVSFVRLELPFVSEAVDLACRFHQDLPYFATLGWDVAITPSGPVVIEVNDNWGGGMMSGFVPEFTRTFWAGLGAER